MLALTEPREALTSHATNASFEEQVQSQHVSTNPGHARRIRLMRENSGRFNAALLKVNQAGTVSETREALDAARQAGFGTIVSARSGETEDVTIAHLAVGWNAGQFKVGSFSGSERMAKWNEMLRIEESLGSAARFADLSELCGGTAFSG